MTDSRRAGKRREKRLTQQPWFAAVLLGAGLWVASASLFGSSASPPGIDTPPAWEEPLDEAAGADVADASGPGRDLVAEFGVYDGSDPVPECFAALPEAAATVLLPAAPSGETAGDATQWTGDPPPQLVVGVIFVGERSRRAVVGGRVVGIGEVLGEARIESIERKGLLVVWRNRLLTYDMQSPFPREYRARAQQQAGEQGNEASGDVK